MAKEARRAACLLSDQEQNGAIGVELLRDIRSAFGDANVIRSSDLVAKLTADPERPWAEWKRGRPLTQKQLAGMLSPFHIISLTVHPPGLPDGKGYRRIDFKEAWAAFCPNTPSQRSLPMTWAQLAFGTDRKTPSCPTAMRVWTFRRISRKWAMRSACGLSYQANAATVTSI